uniref:Glutamate/phenylalanine/leucine/valine/L-tryptophan dehydrogenase C-terminal domain-containing protein n=2 Tax=Lotharella globosa TaxID=91324 RepID=A0A7S3Z4N6_9EUKA
MYLVKPPHWRKGAFPRLPLPLPLPRRRAATPMRMLCAGGGMGGENGGVVKVPELKREKSMGWLNSEKADLLEEAMKKSLVHDLVDHNRESANQVVPWFLENMPEDYFNQLSKEVWYGHLRALNALFEMKESPDLLLKSPCDNFVTFIKSHNYTGLVDEMITELPKRKSPTHARLFTSVDCVLAINVFGYGEQKLAREEDIEERYLASMLTFLQNSGGPPEEHAHLFTEDAMRKYMSMCPSSYLNLCSPQRFIKQRIQYERVQGNELVDVKVSRNYLWHSRKDEDEKYTLLSIATHNHSPRVTLENFASYMASANLDIEFLYMDRILDTHESGHVDVLSILLKDPPNMHDKEWEEIRSDLERIKWVDTAALEAFNYSRTQATGLTLQQAEILSALCHMLHGQLNSGTMDITLDKMLTSVYGHYLAIAIDICSLFERRFHPTQGLTKQEEDLEYERISGRVSMVVEETMRTTLDKMLTVVKDARKTNLYVPQRKGLGISVNPANLSTPKHVAGLPYGVLFMHGRRSNLFHVRFREHSRGGMRVATPNSPQEYTLRSLNHYEEAYGLAATQHAKNKDIAEGGSKAVLLVRTHDYDDIKAMQTHQRVKQGANKNEEEQKILEEAKTARDGLIFRSVRMAADSLLDLIIPDPELEKYIKRTPEAPEQEFVYLGPDEQITPTHINWITDQAKLRHLPYATAFMSSKPLSGINHKEYGVTSEGVCIFLDVALRNMGKDPTERPFTLKITGGTSGDVAGNAIKILNRDYGENAKIVGIVDHKGCCEDPSGLDLTELMRLVNNELSLEHFDESKLSSDGKFWSRDNPEGVVMCDSMHNRLQTDAFLPAGGLPNTIRTDNWEAFLTEDVCCSFHIKTNNEYTF